MVVRAVMNAWLVSRQQSPCHKQHLPQVFEADADVVEPDFDGYAAPARDDDAFDDDAAIDIEKRNDFVPRRRGGPAESAEHDGFWSNALFWKGIVFGLLAVVLVKMVFEVQAPLGVDWYLY